MDVTPEKQNIDEVFGNRIYHIDFYQRQYKWTEEPVKRLLEDIFYKFNLEYERHKASDIPLEQLEQLEQLITKFAWYYLNTYVTNSVDGKVYVVDGQQRLTTLILILIKLKHFADQFHSRLKDWINSRIAGPSGYKKIFGWITGKIIRSCRHYMMESL